MNIHQMPGIRKGPGNKKLRIAAISGAVLLVAAATGLFLFLGSIKPPDITPPPLTPPDGTEDDEDRYLDIAQSGQREGVYTFIVAGVDNDLLHTDVLMLVTFDTVLNKLNVLSIPRDTMVKNNYTGPSKKINASYGRRGGIENTLEEVYNLTGIRANRYAVSSFSGFAAIIDAVGGVDFDVPRNMRYSDPTQKLYINIKKGPQTLNGKTAVELVRYRQYLTGDLGRIDMTQQFLRALANKIISELDLINVINIAGILISECKTDLTLGELTWFAQQVGRLTEDDITFMMLPGEGNTVDGISFFLPDREQTIEMINTYMNPYGSALKESAFNMVKPPYKAY